MRPATKRKVKAMRDAATSCLRLRDERTQRGHPNSVAIERQHVVSVGRIGEPWDQELEGHRPRYWPMVRRTLFSGRVLLDDSLSW